MSNPSIEAYTIGWICALQEEYDASCCMFDAEFDGPDTGEPNDNNTYAFGQISGHYVVIGCLPGGQYGTSSAASVARDMVRSFTKLRFALMVGIGGGAPTAGKDIRLGDVVVSQPQGKLGGVLQYDFGKQLSNGIFEQTGQLNAPPPVVLGALPEMRRRHNNPKKPDRIAEHVKLMDDMPSYQRPANDRLYRTEYSHNGGDDCEDCESGGLVQRPSRSGDRITTVHYGIIASANSVMKNPQERDKYAKDPALNVLCFEMEAGGLMNNFPCLVIRGICDYSDSHKNDSWHHYAALVAAAYARELLHVLKPANVDIAPSWGGKLEELLASIRGDIEHLSADVSGLVGFHQNQADEAILDWITTTDHGAYQSDAIKLRQPGTGQWLLGSENFRRWLESSNQTLYCTGPPGVGKTILTSIVIEFLKNRFRGDANIGVAYIYCKYDQQEKQMLNHLLENVLKQLCHCAGSLPQCVRDLYDTLRTEGTRPSIEQLSDTLKSVVSSFSLVFIMIDALDECLDARDSRERRLVETVLALQTSSGVNIFVTSRNITEIEEQFKKAVKLSIQASKEDLRLYLGGQMGQLLVDVSESPEVRQAIETKIIEAASGVYVALALFTKIKS
ncbi:hypothetical protein V2A60_010392 [Cordyceps javanica]